MTCGHGEAWPRELGQSLEEMDFERGIWTAALDGNVERIEAFLRKGVQPDIRDSSGFTALHYASRAGHEAACRALLVAGAAVDARTPGGATPLHRAATQGHHPVISLLLHHGGDPGLTDGDGCRPSDKVTDVTCRHLFEERVVR
uniref:ankyrin repeat domain-containing protein 39-like n=1 Tax=Myxine glutinosa TaxID=7769 RepID=UPI00358E9B12